MVKPDIPFIEFHPVNRNGRNKTAHDPFGFLNRYAPDPEKAKDMVYAESIKINRHLFKTILPPAIIILIHLLPVVSRKSPVLALQGEGVRRRACLLIQVKEFRRHPGIATIPVNANRNIPFDYHTVFMGVIGRIAELQVEMVLNKIMQGDLIVLFGLRSGQPVNAELVVPAVGFPFCKISSSVYIPQITKCGVWGQPELIVFEKLYVLRIFIQIFFLQLIKLSEYVQFGTDY